MPSNYHECEDRIQKAIDALNRRDFPSMLAAAEYFDVPYNRLRLRYQGKPSRIANGGRNRKLSDEQESALINYVRQQYTSGYNRLRWDQVQRAANTLLAQTHPTGDPPPSLHSGQDASRKSIPNSSKRSSIALSLNDVMHTRRKSLCSESR